MAVRPEMNALAEAIWAAVAAPDVEPGSPAAYRRWRAGYDAFGDGLPRPGDIRIEPVVAGSCPTERVVPTSGSTDRVVLFAHGGGYVIGSPVSHRNFAAHLAVRSGATVVLPAYRLSPEWKAGAAVEDFFGAYVDLLDRGHDPSSVVVGGDSAGGGVALATLLAIRDGGLPRPGRAILLSPWLDMTRLETGSRVTFAAEPMYDAGFTLMMAAAVVGDGDPADHRVSPLLADLEGLPPLLVHTGQEEAMRDDADRVARRARSAGVPVTLRVWDGAGHNFQVFPGFFPAGGLAWDALDDIAAFVSSSR